MAPAGVEDRAAAASGRLALAPALTATRVVNAQVSVAIIDLDGHWYRAFLSSAPRRTVATDAPEQQLTAGFADAVILRD